MSYAVNNHACYVSFNNWILILQFLCGDDNQDVSSSIPWFNLDMSGGLIPNRIPSSRIYNNITHIQRLTLLPN